MLTKTPPEMHAPPRMRIVMFVGFALLLISLAAVVVLGLRFSTARDWVQHTVLVRQVEQSLLAAVTSAEANQRNYLLGGDAGFADAAERDQHAVGHLQARLQSLTSDNKPQSERLSAIVDLVRQRFDLLNQQLGMARAGQRDAAVALATDGRGKALMEEIKASIDTFDVEEQRLFSVREGRVDSERWFLVALIATAMGIGLALGIAAFVASGRYITALQAQNEALVRESAQRERAEAALRQSQKMEALGRLTGGIAHDFNNMLAVISGNIEMMLRRIEQGPDRIRPLATNALEGAKRAAVLTQRLLAFSRQMPLSPKPLDANRVVTGVMSMLNRALGERVAVETVLGAGVWRIRADEPQLESALLNLAVNARDAMADGGKLTIETSNSFLDERYVRQQDEDVLSGQYVLISVTDDGHGMSAEVAAKAFEPFFTTKSAGAGTGLGLSQVHGFLKQSGGHIKIYSEPGVGTTIKLYFPRYTGADEIVEAEPVLSAREPLGCKVLLVEDEEGVRTFVASALAELGCEVVEAADAESALKQLDTHGEVTVLLTDVVMPGKSGRELADIARDRRPGLKVLYMTGYTRNAIVHNGMLDSGTHLLTKPFTLSELELRLEKLLRGDK